MDQFGGQGGEPVASLFGIAVFEEDRLPLHIAQVAQALLEGWETACGMLLGAWFQHADAGDFPPWLRRDHSRRHQDAKGEHDDERQNFHWSTSSAWKRSVGGIGRPRALAVFRLITSSNLVGCSTGRSAGFVPFRILSTYTASCFAVSRRFGPYDMSPPASTYSRHPNTLGRRCFAANSAIWWRCTMVTGSGKTRRASALSLTMASNAAWKSGVVLT